MDVKTILEEVQASLEPYRQAERDAQVRQRQTGIQTQGSRVNLFKAQTFATDAKDRLAAHQESMRVKRAEWVQAQAAVIASGGEPESRVIEFDQQLKRFQDEAGEADDVLSQVQTAYDQRCNELAKAEAAVHTANAAISTAYIEGVATRMMGLQSLIIDLHAELSKAAPDEINSRPGTYQRLPDVVKQALALVMVNPIHVSGTKLRGYDLTPAKWTPTSGPRVHTGFQEETPMFVGGDHKPRNADLIPQKI